MSANNIAKFRFAPSPTGLIHLGNTRTALFNYLFSHHLQGTFLLRIEDTDKARSTEAFAKQLGLDLKWLGLDWQEGPGEGGEHGPYYQSQRHSIYDAYYQILEEKGYAYPCYCSETELAIQRKLQLATGKPPRYTGICRHLTQAECQSKEAQGLRPTLRFRIPEKKMIEFNDFVKGSQRFNTEDLGDFIIRRMDGTASFMFCNAIDDALMKVTHVMRGEDHLTNTPRQLLILKALHLNAPQYGHISLIVGHDGAPLSKRHGSRNIQELQAEGFLPIGVINYLARLGHSYEDNHLMSYQELGEKFRVERLSRSPAKFDEDQLVYWQKQALQSLDDKALWLWMGLPVHSIVPVEKKALFIDTVRPHLIFPQDALHWATLLFDEHLAYDSSYLPTIIGAGKAFYEAGLMALEQQGADYSAVTEAIKSATGLKGKGLFQPLRIILSNQDQGPEMAKLFQLLGESLIGHRFKAAIKLIQVG